MILDKTFFEKEISNKTDEMGTLDINIDGFQTMIEAANLNKNRLKSEISLINSYIDLLSQEAVAGAAPIVD